MKCIWINAGLISLFLLVSGCQAYQATTPDETLTNTYWKLVTLNDHPIATVENFREPHLVLHEENTRLAGSTGCNNLMGSYHAEGEYLAFEQVATTLMACPETQMRNERAMLSMLTRSDTWQIKGGTLSLKQANGNPLAVFEAVHLY